MSLRGQVHCHWQCVVACAVPVVGQWPMRPRRYELQMREEADSESDLRPPQVPHRDDAGPGPGLRLRLQTSNRLLNARHPSHAVPVSRRPLRLRRPFKLPVRIGGGMRKANQRLSARGPFTAGTVLAVGLECMSQNRSCDKGGSAV